MHLPRLILVPRYSSHRIYNIRSCLVRKPHQAPYQLAKRLITHGFNLVEFLELQTGPMRVIPPRPNIKRRRGVFSERLLQNRQVTSIEIPRNKATSISPTLAQGVDRDKVV